MKIKNILSILLCIITIALTLVFHERLEEKIPHLYARNVNAAEDFLPDSLYAGIVSQTYQYNHKIVTGEISLDDIAPFSEDEVYTFLQGHRAWSAGATWSGQWCQKYAKGQYFSGFGCGFCCVANVYSSLSPYTCSPLDVYDYAYKETGYAPTKASAALDWGNMKVILRDMGMDCDVYYKANDYADFQKQVKTSKMTIALVSSANDDKLWQRVPGHYVTLCLYNPTDDTILLGDPGSPTNNRSRVPLSYVYDALKTTSKFQYLLVDDYAEADNTWLHDGIDDNWIAPENL